MKNSLQTQIVNECPDCAKGYTKYLIRFEASRKAKNGVRIVN